MRQIIHTVSLRINRILNRTDKCRSKYLPIPFIIRWKIQQKNRGTPENIPRVLY